MSITVDASKCNGCTLCVKSCATNAIEVKDKLATIELESCTMCGACVSACRFGAIIHRHRQAAGGGPGSV